MHASCSHLKEFTVGAQDSAVKYGVRYGFSRLNRGRRMEEPVASGGRGQREESSLEASQLSS